MVGRACQNCTSDGHGREWLVCWGRPAAELADHRKVLVLSYSPRALQPFSESIGTAYGPTEVLFNNVPGLHFWPVPQVFLTQSNCRQMLISPVSSRISRVVLRVCILRMELSMISYKLYEPHAVLQEKSIDLGFPEFPEFAQQQSM